MRPPLFVRVVTCLLQGVLICATVHAAAVVVDPPQPEPAEPRFPPWPENACGIQPCMVEIGHDPCPHGTVEEGSSWCLPSCDVSLADFEDAFRQVNCIPSHVTMECILEWYDDWCDLVQAARLKWLTGGCCDGWDDLKENPYSDDPLRIPVVGGAETDDEQAPPNSDPETQFISPCKPTDLPGDPGEVCEHLTKWLQRLACISGDCPPLACEEEPESEPFGDPEEPESPHFNPDVWGPDHQILSELIKAYLKELIDSASQEDRDDLLDWLRGQDALDCLGDLFGCPGCKCDECQDLIGIIIGDPEGPGGPGGPEVEDPAPPDPGHPTEDKPNDRCRELLTSDPVDLGTGAKVQWGSHLLRNPLTPRGAGVGAANRARAASPVGFSAAMGHGNRREYSSNPDYAGAGLVGERHGAVEFAYATVSTDDGITIVELHDSTVTRRFRSTSPDGPFFNPGPSPGVGPSADVIESGFHVVDGTPHAVLRHVLPDGSTTLYHRQFPTAQVVAGYGTVEPTPAPMVGLKLLERDAAGNVGHFKYTLMGTVSPQARLSARLFNRSTASSGDFHSRVAYIWEVTGQSNVGRLRTSLLFRRPAEGGSVAVERTRYRYKGTWSEDVSEVHSMVGTPGDLIQVTTEEFLDDGGVHLRIEQYRYHVGDPSELNPNGSGSDANGNGFIEQGSVHQLRMVIEPAAIEYLARHSTNPTFDSVQEAAEWLLAQSDVKNLNVGIDPKPQVTWLASKVIAQYEPPEPEGRGRILLQYVQQACGCGSSGGRRVAYEYWAYEGSEVPSETVRIVEHTGSEGVFGTLRRVTYHDLARFGEPDDPPYLLTEAIYLEDPEQNSNADAWVTHHDYDDQTRLVLRTYTPAACVLYTPGVAADGQTPHVLPVYQSGAGLVHAFEYNDDKMVTHRYVRDGVPNDPEDLSEYVLVERLLYLDEQEEPDRDRRAYPKSVHRYRVEGADPSTVHDDDVEVLTFEYGFWEDTADLAWRRTFVERDLVSEHGPGHGDPVEITEAFDRDGRLLARLDGNGLATRYTYDPHTNDLVAEEANPSSVELPQDHPLATTGWGGAAGGVLDAVRTYLPSARPRSVTSPDGVTTWTVTQMLPIPGVGGPPLLCTTVLPHVVVDSGPPTTLLPAVRTWLNVDGEPVRISTYTVTGPIKYHENDPFGFTLAEEDELSRREFIHDVGGRLVETRQWHDLSVPQEFASTRIEYDDLGRVLRVIGTDGTYVQYGWDHFDRRVTESIGTTDEPDYPSPTLIASWHYDAVVDGQDPEEFIAYVGNGLLTQQREYAGPDDEDWRQTAYHHDYRGRLMAVEHPTAPHEVFRLDNLGRVIAEATFSVLPGTLNETAVLEPANRGSYVEHFYSQRGLRYRSRVKLNPLYPQSFYEPDDDYLVTNRWFDARGDVLVVKEPDAPVWKVKRDVFGRVEREYLTDGRGDPAPGTSNSYAAITSVETNCVLAQTTSRYDDRGLPELVTTHRRTQHANPYAGPSYDPIHRGDLAQGNNSSWTVRTYRGLLYDEVARPSRQVDFGTNYSDDVFKGGGPEPTWPPSTTPEHDHQSWAKMLVSAWHYDARGHLLATTDPTGRRREHRYDDGGRLIATIDNALESTPVTLEWSGSVSDGRWIVTSGLSHEAPDVNVTTTYARDRAGRVIREVAHAWTAGGEQAQVTSYLYGVSLSLGSSLHSNALLYAIVHPRRDTGEYGPVPADSSLVSSFAYNRLGEMIQQTDRNGTVREFTRDAAGRVISDQATTLPAGLDVPIDGTIRRIDTAYDAFGRMASVTSRTSINPGGNIRDQVTFGYTPLGLLDELRQNHAGSITSGNGHTRTVTYHYRKAGALSGNSNRLEKIVYPGGLEYRVGYGSSQLSISHRIGRPSSVVIDGNDQARARFVWSYLGLGTPVHMRYVDPGIALDRQRPATGATTTGSQYHAFDRFGRLRNQRWLDDDFAPHATEPGTPNIPPIVDLAMTWDKSGRLLSRVDARPGAARNDRHEEFHPDGIGRLREEWRGVRTSGSIGESTGFAHAPTLDGLGSRRWGLDALGNWTQVDEDPNASGVYATTQKREHNQANELLALDPDGPGGTPAHPLTYDDSGSLVERSISHDHGGWTQIHVHDAWGRLVEVRVRNESTSVTRVRLRQEYNGLNWRTVRIADTKTTGGVALPDGILDQLRIMIYDAGWRLIQERIHDGFDPGTDSPQSPGTLTRRVSSVPVLPGTGAADQVLMRRTRSFPPTGNPVDTDHYLLHDHLGSTVAVLDRDAKLLERVRYDAYGHARHSWGNDVDGDGDADATDRSIVGTAQGKGIADAGYIVDADINRDGVINSTDLALVGTSAYATALRAGAISAPWLPRQPLVVDNVIGYAAYTYNVETGLYTVPFRHYDPILGRWIQRDPLGTVDGLNLYAYVGGMPLWMVDPMGLASVPQGAVVEAFTRRDDGVFQVDVSLKTTQGHSAILSLQQESGGAYAIIRTEGENTSEFQQLMSWAVENWHEEGRLKYSKEYADQLADRLQAARDGLLADANIRAFLRCREEAGEWTRERTEHLRTTGELIVSAIPGGGVAVFAGNPTGTNAALAMIPIIGPAAKAGLGAAARGITRPTVADPKLKNLVNDLYKGASTKSPIGTGSTADAIRHELATGQAVGGRFHAQKGQEYARALEKWLSKNPGASAGDRAAAQSILNDLRSALGGN